MDLFYEEQKIYEHAVKHIKEVDAGETFNFEEFKILVKEYHAILKQLRRLTKFSDKTAVDLHESNLELIDKVNYDTLTGIYSRRFMEEKLESTMREATQSGSIISILMMDIDFFKNYNDLYGHSAGDVCLKAVAGAIADCITCTDGFAARYGGEEFIAVLPNIDKEDAEKTAGKILENVRSLNIVHEKNEAAGYVTISIGVTTFQPKPEVKIVEYIKKADFALYYSKKNGKNCFTYAEKEDTE